MPSETLATTRRAREARLAALRIPAPVRSAKEIADEIAYWDERSETFGYEPDNGPVSQAEYLREAGWDVDTHLD